MISKEMLDWLQEQEEDDVDGYLDVDLVIKEWAGRVKDMEEKEGVMLGLIGGHVNLDEDMHKYLFGKD